MINQHQKHGEDLESLSSISMGLARLMTSIDHAREFSKKFSKFLSLEDRAEMTAIASKMDGMYWKYFEKFLKKVRGF